MIATRKAVRFERFKQKKIEQKAYNEKAWKLMKSFDKDGNFPRSLYVAFERSGLDPEKTINKINHLFISSLGANMAANVPALGKKETEELEEEGGRYFNMACKLLICIGYNLGLKKKK